MSAAAGSLQLRVRCRGMRLSRAERESAERMFRLTLARFEAQLQRVELSFELADDTDPPWSRCLVWMVDRHGSALLVEGSDRDPAGCAARALRRAERELRRRARGVGGHARGDVRTPT